MQVRVVYDGLCPLCLGSKAVLERLDVTRQLGFLDLEREWPRVIAAIPALSQDAARAAMHTVDRRGRVHAGFFAFRRIARALPLLWPLLPLLWLPGMSRIGPWAYAQVASRRRRVACATGSCGIHPAGR